LRADNRILFTFDDGPHPEITPRVLDILDRWGCRAIFFIPAFRIERAPQLLGEIIQRGHAIGNHTFSHTDPAKLSFRQCKAEIDECQHRLAQTTGIKTKYFRSPNGRVTIPLMMALRACKMHYIRWSMDTGEYSHSINSNSTELAKNFLDKIHNRAIVLSHDDNMMIPKMLEIVLPVVLDMGFNLMFDLDSL
jgi:peptidoglycan-N-acetylglucosamine deacetylase